MADSKIAEPNPVSAEDLNLVDLLTWVIRRWKLVIGGSLAVGTITFACSFLISPQFTAKTTFIPPQSSSSTLGAALNSLGPLAGLANAGNYGRSAETYVALLKSRTLNDRLIERFKLKDTYKVNYNFEAREALAHRTRIDLNKKDGMVSVEFDDTDPARAAIIANNYVSELVLMTAQLALTDAQRRRAFFQTQLEQSRKKLTFAQSALQDAGFDAAALKTEPRATAEEYAKVKAELAASEIRLGSMRMQLADSAPEIKSLAATINGLRQQLQILEQKGSSKQSQDYVSRYREFKYQETLFEQLAKQFEAARLEESREDSTIQVIDVAITPEWKSKPKRASMAIAAMLITALLISIGVVARQLRRIARLTS